MASDPWGQALLDLPPASRYTDDAAALAYYIAVRWPEGIRCPHCDSTSAEVRTRNERLMSEYICAVCGEYFSVKSRSVFHASKVPLRKWALAEHCFERLAALRGPVASSWSVKSLAGTVGVRPRAFISMWDRLRSYWQPGKPDWWCLDITAAERRPPPEVVLPRRPPESCVRCGTRLVVTYRDEYPSCHICGWEDYEHHYRSAIFR